MVPLGHTNKVACDVKLLLTTDCPDMYTMAVFVLYSIHSSSFLVPVDGSTYLQLPTHPNTHPARPPPIELIHDIGGVQKKVSQNPAVLAT